MKTLAERIQVIEYFINKETKYMEAILNGNGVQIMEDISDKEQCELWNESYKRRRYLNDQLQRIDSILNSCERFSFVNI